MHDDAQGATSEPIGRGVKGAQSGARTLDRRRQAGGVAIGPARLRAGGAVLGGTQGAR